MRIFKFLFLLTALLTAPVAEARYTSAAFDPNVQKKDSGGLTLGYDIYAGGFKALAAQLSMNVDPAAYDMNVKAETQGMIGSLFPWKGVYTTSGHTEKGALVPAVYTAHSIWRDKLSTTEMDYSPSGKLLKTTTQSGQKTTVERNGKEKMSAGAVDMLTGTLAMLQSVGSANACTGKYPVFDGKRRYNITLKPDGKDTLAASKYSKFSGEALRCIVLVEPVAGFSAKDQKRGWMAVQNHTEAHNKLPTLWLAKVHGSKHAVPVRMEIASDYGSVVAHLTSGL